MEVKPGTREGPQWMFDQEGNVVIEQDYLRVLLSPKDVEQLWHIHEARRKLP